MLVLQTLQEARGVVDVARGIEHVGDAAELVSVVVEVDLHAAKVDELVAGAARSFEFGNRHTGRWRKDRAALDVQRVRMEAALPAGLRKPHGVKDPGRYAVISGGSEDVPLAAVRSGLGSE